MAITEKTDTAHDGNIPQPKPLTRPLKKILALLFL